MIIIAAPEPNKPTGGHLVNSRLAQNPQFRIVDAENLEAVLVLARAADPSDVVIADSLLLWDAEPWPAARKRMGASTVPMGLLAHSLPSLLPGDVSRRRRFLQGELAHLPAFDFIVSPSRFMDGALARRGVQKDRIVRVDLPPIVDGRSVDLDVGAPNRAGPVRILTIANWSRFKGPDSVWRALAELAELEWHWTTVGSWENTNFGRRLHSEIVASKLASRVSLHNTLPPSELAAEYQAADVFVLPTVMESYGLVFAEAISFSLPVVGFRSAAVPEVVGQSGVLTRAGDKVALRGALHRVLSDHAHRHELARKSAHRASRLPVWPDATADLAAAILDQVQVKTAQAGAGSI